MRVEGTHQNSMRGGCAQHLSPARYRTVVWIVTLTDTQAAELCVGLFKVAWLHSQHPTAQRRSTEEHVF